MNTKIIAQNFIKLQLIENKWGFTKYCCTLCIEFKNKYIMATIYLSLSEKSDTNPQREIRIRFKHGKIDQQAMTNIFIPLEYCDETTRQIIVPNFRLMNDEKRNSNSILPTKTKN
jgi:hypothetical protein